MNLDDYALLSELLNDIKKERKEVDAELQSNLSSIRAEDIYAQNFMDSESEDYKVFSPRNMESMYRDEIAKIQNQKSGYEEKNKVLYHKKNTLSLWIDRIEKILENENNDLDILNIQEQDRQRIARDLHDTSLQNLTHLIHQIELSSLYIDEDPVRAKLELSVVNKRLRETIDEIRNTIFDLRPMTFDDLGLKASFEKLVDSINEDGRYEIELDLENVSCETNLVLATIYRVVQEAFNNIKKHSEASKIYFSCKSIDDMCHIVIKDNGIGFDELIDEGRKHFGIFCMEERIKLLGGKIEITSVPDEGTTILIDVPLNT